MSQYLNHVRNFNTPHGTGLVDFPHPALQLNSQKLLPCIKVVDYFRFGERIAFQIVGKLLPAHLSLLTAPVEPFARQSHGNLVKLLDARVVFADPVILDMPSNLGPENLPPFLGFNLVPDFPQPLVHRLALGDKLLTARPASYFELSSS